MHRRGPNERNTWRMDLRQCTSTSGGSIYGTMFITRGLENFGGDILTSPEIIRTQTLNYKPNFKFSRLKIFFGGPPSQLWCALAIRLSQSVTRIKIWEGSTPQGPKCSLPNNVRSDRSIWVTKTFLFVDQSSPIFSPNVLWYTIYRRVQRLSTLTVCIATCLWYWYFTCRTLFCDFGLFLCDFGCIRSN